MTHNDLEIQAAIYTHFAFEVYEVEFSDAADALIDAALDKEEYALFS